jgi:hypothetical protein
MQKLTCMDSKKRIYDGLNVEYAKTVIKKNDRDNIML